MKYQAPRGTYDVTPQEIYTWHYLEDIIRKNMRLFHYQEIRFPLFDRLELFERGVGEGTDIVEKEMYVFSDKKGRQFALRPEGTACVARAYVERKLNGTEKGPLRVFYMGPMFRYNRPQKGRYRQFSQFGVECIGSSNPYTDAEVIALGWKIYQDAKVPHVNLQINSVGCPVCRAQYNEALRTYLQSRYDDLCPDCQRRMQANPLRVFDCKVDGCKAAIADAPIMLNHLCDECKTHFASVQENLHAMNVPFVVNARIVRGLDYYSKTAFEYKIDYLGAQDAVGGGGRYDGLIGFLGGKETPAVGLSGGFERVLLALEQSGVSIPSADSLQVFVIPFNQKCQTAAVKLSCAFHDANFSAQVGNYGTSLKTNLKYCDTENIAVAVLIGDDELAAHQAIIKDLKTKKQITASLETVVSTVKSLFQAR